MPFSGSPSNSRLPSPDRSPKTTDKLDINNLMEFPLPVKVKLEPKTPERPSSAPKKIQPFFYPVPDDAVTDPIWRLVEDKKTKRN